MENNKEKKWFIYMMDHHEGPFSKEEICYKIQQGLVTTESYAWSEGMTDWLPIVQIEELMTIGEGKNQKTQSYASQVMQLISPQEEKTQTLESLPQKQPEGVQSPSLKKHTLKVIQWILLFLTGGIFLGFILFQGACDSFLRALPLSPRWSAALDQLWAYRLEVLDELPSLSSWIDPLPKTLAVTLEEVEHLKKAMLDPQSKSVAFVLSQEDLMHPSFYVAARLPDQTTLMINLVGIPKTLLGSLSVSTQATVTLINRLGQSAVVLTSQGTAIPKGEYRVYVSAGLQVSTTLQSLFASMPSIPYPRVSPEDLSQEVKVLAFKTYFLGGERDAQYLQSLKEYHQTIKQKATEEVKEIHQFLVTLESQLTASLQKFHLAQKGKNNIQQKESWLEFHQQWVALNKKLGEIFDSWRPEEIKEQFFYYHFYAVIQKLGHLIEKIHFSHNMALQGIEGFIPFDVHLKENIKLAEGMISQLKKHLAQIEVTGEDTNIFQYRDLEIKLKILEKI